MGVREGMEDAKTVKHKNKNEENRGDKRERGRKGRNEGAREETAAGVFQFTTTPEMIT